MKRIAIVATILMGTAAQAQDACTPDAIQSKSGQATAAIQTIASANPSRGQELTAEIEAMMTAIQEGADIATVCVFFDKVIAEAQG
ncbi:hypothetical protein [Yoonia sediminilitoris]|uniref:Uncharacterized protein n=1 Tax=Yoonia sediminilitoris TaxID=1286148 RepID=A0A2T6KN03_9RHOB|nr:hypothetical protein [Yoonia sediminilitoris]PUB17589.1 hypothetical protein C8N45_102601 [Yoonia sediminilitoris]RCW97884.1 hypothetical protein DFP92_102601 [Yoonia sediminilitoris]